MKNKCIIAFSGGRTSAYMTYQLLNQRDPPFDYIVVFANTGREREETLNFIRKCDRYLNFNTVWVEGVTNPKHGRGVTAKVVTFETASRDGEPFEASIAKHGISNVNAPMCTRELKTYTINAYLRSIKIKGAYRAIGIRADEFDRMAADAKAKRYIYPLVSVWPTKKSDVINWWSAAPFDLYLEEHQGNCDCCFKKALAKLLRTAREEPERFEWWHRMEVKYSNYIPATRPLQKIEPVHFYRGDISAAEIINLAGLSDIEVVVRLAEIGVGDVGTVEDLETTFNGCSESCEAF